MRGISRNYLIDLNNFTVSNHKQSMEFVDRDSIEGISP